VSLSVVTVASDAYADYLPRWAASVAALETQPDEVVIGVQSVPAVLPLHAYTLVMLDGDYDFAAWYNRVIDSTTSEWVAWIGSDDAYRPHALDGIERDDADVVAFGLQYDTGQTWMPSPTRTDVLRMQSNVVPCGSPFRRRLWEAYPFRSEFNPLMDWGLWAGFAAIGARFAATGRIDVDYAYAGHVAPPDEPIRTYICDWLQSL